MPKTIIDLQQEYVDSVNSCSSSHVGRVRGGAARQFILAMHNQGFEYEQIAQAFKDADDMMLLERVAEQESNDLHAWENASLNQYCRDIRVANTPAPTLPAMGLLR